MVFLIRQDTRAAPGELEAEKNQYGKVRPYQYGASNQTASDSTAQQFSHKGGGCDQFVAIGIEDADCGAGDWQ
jgi:hypothetical protein